MIYLGPQPLFPNATNKIVAVAGFRVLGLCAFGFEILRACVLGLGTPLGRRCSLAVIVGLGCEALIFGDWGLRLRV